MSTLTLDPAQIEKVVRDEASASGAYRDVWFFGDIVIKKDQCSWGTSRDEFERSKVLKPSNFIHEGELWTVRFPQCSMVGDYLIMERITLRHPTAEGCDKCQPEYVEESFYWRHAPGCPVPPLVSKVDRHCADEYGMYDIHAWNWMPDYEEKIAWVIDFGE